MSLTTPEVQEQPLPPDGGRQTVSVRSLLASVLLSLAVIGLVLVVTYEPETLALVAGMSVLLLASAVGLVALQILVTGARLTYIAHGNLSFTGGIRGAIGWDFMSAVTPSSMGGAPLAAFFLARDNRLPVGEATAIILFAMLADQVWFAVSIPLVLVAALHFDVIPDALGGVGTVTLVLLLVVVMLWAFFFAYATLIRPAIIEWVATRLVRLRWLRRFEGRLRRELVSMRQRGQVLRGQPPSFYASTFLLSVVIWSIRYGTLVVVILALYPPFDVVTGFLRTAAMLLSGLIVPTPGGSGGIEGLYVLFLAPLMPAAAVGPTLLVWRLISYHLFIAAGLVVMVQFVSRKRRGLAGRPIRVPRRRRTTDRDESDAVERLSSSAACGARSDGSQVPTGTEGADPRAPDSAQEGSA